MLFFGQPSRNIWTKMHEAHLRPYLKLLLKRQEFRWKNKIITLPKTAVVKFDRSSSIVCGVRFCRLLAKQITANIIRIFHFRKETSNLAHILLMGYTFVNTNICGYFKTIATQMLCSHIIKTPDFKRLQNKSHFKYTETVQVLISMSTRRSVRTDGRSKPFKMYSTFL